MALSCTLVHVRDTAGERSRKWRVPDRAWRRFVGPVVIADGLGQIVGEIPAAEEMRTGLGMVDADFAWFSERTQILGQSRP